MRLHTEDFFYYHGSQEMRGFLAYDASTGTPRPTILVAPDWSGRNDFACNKARKLAEMGCVGMTLDMYGNGYVAQTLEEKKLRLQTFLDDQKLLRDRVFASFEAITRLPVVNSEKIAIIGFCFGGMCALELARSGADIKGVVSFHGILNNLDTLPGEKINAKILALHGYDDPMVSPEQVHRFCDEMNKAQVDWQMHMYGGVQHAFTNPDAHDMELGTLYNETAAKRSWTAMTDFLQELFASH